MTTNMEEKTNTTIVRQILQHEITWVIMIIAGVWGFVNTVILPISNIQVTLSQIQTDITQSKADFKLGELERLQNKSRLDVLETKVDNIIKKN